MVNIQDISEGISDFRWLMRWRKCAGRPVQARLNRHWFPSAYFKETGWLRYGMMGGERARSCERKIFDTITPPHEHICAIPTARSTTRFAATSSSFHASSTPYQFISDYFLERLDVTLLTIFGPRVPILFAFLCSLEWKLQDLLIA